jgi:hypothetical protein
LGQRRTLKVAGIAISAVALLSGCEIVDDPTSHSFPITFLNDSNHKVFLKLCLDTDCHHFGYSHEWDPGEPAQENAVAAPGTLLTRWRAEDQTGRTLGCLPLNFNHKLKGVTVQISEAVPCPGSIAVPFRQHRKKVRPG